MTRLEEIRRTHREREEVFAYVADFATTAEYDPGVVSAERTSEGPLGVGSTFLVHARFLGRTLPLSYTVEVFEPPSRVVLVGEGDTSRARDDIRFIETPTGTEIRWVLDLQLTGVARLSEPLAGPFLRRLGRAALDGLATRLADRRPLQFDA